MTSLLFPKLDHFMIGFDDTINMLQSAAKDIQKYTPSYPPYNIKQIKENKYVIEMAVAGFSKTDIEITLEGNKMIVKVPQKMMKMKPIYTKALLIVLLNVNLPWQIR